MAEHEVVLRDYEVLLDGLLQADNSLVQERDKKGVREKGNDYLSWILSDNIRDITMPFRHYIDEMAVRIKNKNLQVRRGFRQRTIMRYDPWRGPRLDPRALAAQNDIRDYLNSLYQKSTTCFSETTNSYLEFMAEIKLLCYFADSYLTKGIESGILEIRSLVSSQGERGIGFLASVYKQLITQFGQVDESQAVVDGLIIRFSAPGLKQLLEYEAGIHLFYEKCSIQIPVLVRVHLNDQINIEEKTLINSRLSKIHRLYTLPNEAKESGTITDLRTGLMSKSNIDLAQWRLFLYSVVAGSQGVNHAD